MVRAISAVVTLLAGVAFILGTTTAFADSSKTKTLVYQGYRFVVPVSWQVVNLDTAPRTCVRFDRHVLYLGVPGSDQTCPAHVVGVTEALLVRPTANAAGGSTTVDDRAEHEIATVAPRITVTATYGADRALIQRVLADAGLPEPGAASPAAVPSLATPRVAMVAGAAATNYTGRGFETCDTPSQSTMNAWAASPYRAVGVYFGGVNRSCKAQPNLTAGWVSQQSSAGWHFLPIYVGPQVSTTSCSGCALITSPSGDGTAAADDAANRAAALGFGTGTVLYYDMESYSLTAGNSATALGFVAAWTQELHARGYRSGYYSSGATGVTDLVNHYTTNVMPDVIDVADYNGAATTSDPYLPASMWANHQRLHQYQGDHNETYGGVTLNVDLDYYDVQLAGGSPASADVGSSALVYGSQLQVFARGGDDALWQTFYDGQWQPWSSHNGTLTSHPVAVVYNGQLQVFVRGSDNGLWQTFFDGHAWQPWASRGGVLNGDPAVVVYNGQLQVFARGTNNALWQTFYDGQWQPWTSHGGTLTGDPVSITYGGQLQVLARGVNNVLYQTFFDGAAWQPWTSRGGTLTGDPTGVVYNGQLQVFACGTNNGLWQTFFDGQAWQPWTSRGGNIKP
jgi:hypothetical protein